VNTEAASASLLTPPRPASAADRLHRLMQAREKLRPLFGATWDQLAVRFPPDDLEAWAEAVLDLADVNAGPSCLIAYWTLSRSQPALEGIAPIITAARTAADICRHADAAAATAALAAQPVARSLLGRDALPRWWRIMDDLARQAPESVEAATSHMDEVLSARSVDAFSNFVAAGLKAASGSKARRLAFFSLQDPLARRLIERASAGVGFADVERATKAFGTSLWGTPPLLRSLMVDGGQAPQRRASIAGPLIRLPEFYRGVQDDAARTLYKAAVAHAQAHLVFGAPRFPIGTLKPLQVALVTLIEDARIEHLAMRRLPGLRRLWSPYHTALAAGITTAPMLLARLARALFDPSHRDDDGFVRKGCALFDAASSRIDDPAISREIGMLLGNDLGQMRVQFNAKTYVVEPVYRDDGLGLWDFGDDAPTSSEAIELTVDAARPEPQEAEQGDAQPEADADANGRAQSVAPDRRGTAIAT
jgi:hypothetical protein